MTTTLGQCACGAVRVQARDLPRDMSACWCDPCRHWQGLCGLGLTLPAEDFAAEGPVRVWQSSEIGERAFCGACGSALWFRPLTEEPVVEPVPGLFEAGGGAVLHHENFTERRPTGIRFEGAHPELSSEDYAAKAPVAGAGPGRTADPLAGGCACGAVRFRAAAAQETCGACHCDSCRHWSGGLFVAATVRAQDMTIEGAEHLLTWASSPWAERVSCGHCGGKLWFHVTSDEGDRTGGAPGDYEVCLGAFDVMEGRPLTSEIFIEDRPDSYALAGDHPRRTGAEALRG